MTDTPWEPPLAGTEADHLLGALDRLRATFRWKADGLDSAGLNVRIGVSSLTIGGLLKHLAVCEDTMFTVKLRGEPIGDPWPVGLAQDLHEWALETAAANTPIELYRLYDAAIARSRNRVSTALSGGAGLDQFIHAGGGRASLRRLICDLIEEYGRHTGHADLLREAVDGRIGEDPPPGWTAVSI
jgi:Protein of unknown function (DUF664)